MLRKVEECLLEEEEVGVLVELLVDKDDDGLKHGLKELDELLHGLHGCDLCWIWMGSNELRRILKKIE